MKKIALMLSAALAAMPALGDNIDFSYNVTDAPVEWYGTGKGETYDVAIHLDNPALAGTTVAALSVAIPDGATDASGWISSELKLRKVNGRNVNAPDMGSAEGTVADGHLIVTFSEPCVVPEGGCYVGYTFTVPESCGQPVAVVSRSDPSGLYLHTSRTKLRWGAVSEELGRVSALSVTLSGELPALSATIVPQTAWCAAGEPFTVEARVVNGCASTINSVEYTWKAGEYSGSGSAVLPAAIPGRIGASAVVPVQLGPVDDSGEYQLSMQVTSVNGSPVSCPATAAALDVYPFLPVNRPLIEEYTGLWCGWCAGGYVALERMKELQGQAFIAAAYHNGDPMAFKDDTPAYPGGYPAAYVNRMSPIEISKIVNDWNNYRNYLPEGDVDVAVEWTDESHTAIRATASARFIKAHSGAGYRVAYILVADNLSDEAWAQHNSYAGKSAEQYPFMDNPTGHLFLDGNAYVQGLTFSDVAVAATDFSGERYSLPEEIAAGETYTHSHTFDISGLDGAVFDNPGSMRVIATLLDGRTGKFINCNSSAHMDGSEFAGVERIKEVPASGEAVEIARYTVDGRRISAPQPGINIILYDDGSARVVMISRR